jgi:hypothetical protein
MFRMLFSVALLTTAVLTAAALAHGADLANFVGAWSCKDNFSNGAPIAAEVSQADTRGGAPIVRHDALVGLGFLASTRALRVYHLGGSIDASSP